MYIQKDKRLGESPRYTPWRAHLDPRSKPQYLRFMNLDRFSFNKASLTPRLMQMVRQLAKHVQMSWKSMQPIGIIRLIGHTDHRGKHDYNVKLGNWRAQTVKAALEKLLKEEILKKRIAILVEESPGALRSTADNQTAAGRAANRRVEVFIAPPDPPTPKIPWPPPPPPPSPVPGGFPWGKLPTLPPGKSLKQFIDEWLRDHRVPKWLRNKVLDAIAGEDPKLVDVLLEQAGIRGQAKEMIMGIIRAGSQVKVR